LQKQESYRRPSLKRDIHRIELCGLEVQAHDKEEKTSGIMADPLHFYIISAKPSGTSRVPSPALSFSTPKTANLFLSTRNKWRKS